MTFFLEWGCARPKKFELKCEGSHTLCSSISFMLLVFMPLIPVKAVIKELIRHINEKSVGTHLLARPTT